MTIVHTLAERSPDASTGEMSLALANSKETTTLTEYHNFWIEEHPSGASKVCVAPDTSLNTSYIHTRNSYS